MTFTGALEKIPKEGTITAKEIADAVGVDVTVITRTMRIVCVQGIGDEVEPDTYRHNAKSLTYVQSPSRWFFAMIADWTAIHSKMEGYFASHSPAELRDVLKSPYAYGHDLEGLSYYQVISHDPTRLEMFNQGLGQVEKSLPILGAFPFSSMKEEVEAEPDRPFIVDVGGGIGRVLMRIQDEAPNGFGAEMILQDRKDVLDSIPDETIPGITKMEHDFFTPQPVKSTCLSELFE